MSVLKLLAARLLKEVNLESEIGDSLDVQVDRYLSSYEKSAQTSKTEGTDFRMLTRRLLEAGEEEPTEEPEEEAEKPEEPSQPAKMTVNDIDIEGFAADVIRLVENFHNLVETRDTVFSRALTYLEKSYDQTALKEFKRALESQGYVIGQGDVDHEAEDFEAPPAAGAGPGGAG